MAKVIDLGLVPPDDPLFEEPCQVFFPKQQSATAEQVEQQQGPKPTATGEDDGADAVDQAAGREVMYVKTGLWPQINEPKVSDLERIIRTLLYVTVNDDYIVYTATNEPCSYMQARPDAEDTFRVEYRDGVAQRHFKKNNVPVEDVITLFQSYRRQDGTWQRAIAWQEITECFDDLRTADGGETDQDRLRRQKPEHPEWYQRLLRDEDL